jgi:phage terminase large subunit-like protein
MTAEADAAREAIAALLAAPPDARAQVLATLPLTHLLWLDEHWPGWRHDGQGAPPGDWRVWLMMAGRGFGKTRAGAEWVLECVRAPERMLGCKGPVAVALVAANPDEARRVMIEGPSGLLACARAEDGAVWEPSLKRVSFAGGSTAFVYSGAHPDGLRGPQHHLAWCDELAKWGKPEESWANLQLGLRLGPRPRALVTTTPRPIAALKSLIGADDVVVTRGRTAANPHVSPAFVAAMERAHGGTRFGRQELDGELIADLEGSLWPRALIERSRGAVPGEGALRRVLVGVDPPAGTAGDACGIVVAGLDRDGVGHVLDDRSAGGLSPEGWARAVAQAAEDWRADRVVAEANMGGEMVRSVLRAAGVRLGVTLVHATRGKIRRTEPVAALFERGAARFAGAFPALEDELAGLVLGGGYHGPGRSPDRADACVWALTALMLSGRGDPRVVAL